ncbi:MAG: hypothetical protein ACRD82_05055, partial [Blastocatellia bacterium]
MGYKLMLRTEKITELFDRFFVPEAQRSLAGGEGVAATTGNEHNDIRVPAGTPDNHWVLLPRPAPRLLPERDSFARLSLRFHRRLISAALPARKPVKSIFKILIAQHQLQKRHYRKVCGGE